MLQVVKHRHSCTVICASAAFEPALRMHAPVQLQTTVLILQPARRRLLPQGRRFSRHPTCLQQLPRLYNFVPRVLKCTALFACRTSSGTSRPLGGPVPPLP